MLSVVIPAYNEEKTVVEVIRGVKEILGKESEPYEIILINDGSTDNTKSLAEKEGVVLVSHPYKKGYGRSLKTGFNKAQGEFVLMIDADSQNYPEEIPSLLEHRKEYDMVVGARKNLTSLPRAMAKKILCLFANYLAEKKIPDLNSGFRVVKKELVLKYMHLLPEAFSFSSTITLAALKDGYSIKFVPIREKKRKSGKSTIHPLKDFVRLGMIILRLTVLFSPFRIFLPISLFLFILGLGYIIYGIFRSFNIPDSGIFLLLSALITFFFGLISDQIATIRRQMK